MTATVSASARTEAEGLAYCGDCAEHAAPHVLSCVYEPEPAPFLGPYLGVVSGVLCALVGAFLLLAPYAFDYRQGAVGVPRSTVLDLATGSAVLLVGLLTAALFGAALVHRLRTPERHRDPEPSEIEFLRAAGRPAEAQPGQDQTRRAADPVPQSEPEPASAPAAPALDPSGALRDLLTPLVAALAADLRARDQRGEGTGPEPEKD